MSHCKRVGEIIAEKGFKLVCAGANAGCQSQLIEGAQAKGGAVIAVTVPMFASELSDTLRKNAIISEGNDLSQRKVIMKTATEFGYIILPGGPGTLDELWEVFAEKAENINNGAMKKLIILNTDGFYEPVKAQINIMRETFKWPYGDGVKFIDDPEQLNELIPSIRIIPRYGAEGSGAGGGGAKAPRRASRRSNRKRGTRTRKN